MGPWTPNIVKSAKSPLVVDMSNFRLLVHPLLIDFGEGSSCDREKTKSTPSPTWYLHACPPPNTPASPSAHVLAPYPLPVCTLGCSEKLENAKSNYGYSYFMAPWYIETEKRDFFNFEIF